jgi:plasmid maintenance system antidote protein VapI
MIRSVIYSEVSSELDNFSDTSDLVEFVTKNNKEIVNKTLTKLAQCVKIESANVRMLRHMENDIIKENKTKIDAIVKASKQFKKIMDNNYSLVNTSLNRKENIFYINSKGVK